MSYRRTLGAAAVALAVVSAPMARADEAPAVVASIAPVHSLVAGVMAGVGAPVLLVPPQASPHTYALRPSEAEALDRADAVFWVSETVETVLTRPLSVLAEDAKVVRLATAPGVELLSVRQGDAWDSHSHGDHDHGHGDHAHGDHGDHAHGDRDHGDHAHGDHDHGHDHAHGDHAHGDHAHGDHAEGDHDHDHGDHAHDADLTGFDSHVWLDPQNAIAMVDGIAKALAEIDPAHAQVYAANGQALTERLTALDASLAERLAPVGETGFVVFHDAYQYFERRYGLTAIASIIPQPEIPAGARRIAAVRERLLAGDAACVFAEPQFDPRRVDVLVEGTSARGGVLDPLGAGIAPGPDAYFTLMDQLAGDLITCLTADS